MSPASRVVAVAVLLVSVAGIAQGDCPISRWSTWQPVNLTADPTPKKLAVQAVQDYVQGLEQTSPDVTCSMDGNFTVDAACLQVRQRPIKGVETHFK